MAWLDTGTHDGLLEASNFIETVQRQSLYVACLEEIAFNFCYISKEKLLELSELLKRLIMNNICLNWLKI